MVNTAAGFSGPSNKAKYSPNYLFVGFLDRATASQKSRQGWHADNNDIFFDNCDANPNSYFAFFPTVTYSSQPYGWGTNYDTTSAWRSRVNGLSAVSNVSMLIIYWNHGGAVVTHSLLTSEVCGSHPRPYVGKGDSCLW